MTDLPLSRSGKNALEVAIRAVREAGQVLLASFQSQRDIKSKGKGNLVSEADMLSEKAILKVLKEEYPDFGFVSEESTLDTSDSSHTWIVDPLDGTNNYVFGIPFFCVNVALTEDKDILMGVTYDPVQEELFYAQKGQDAHLNNSPVYVSGKTSLQNSLVGVDLGYNIDRGRELLDIMIKLWPGVHALRVMGSGALGLAYVACGRIDLYLHRFLYPWDIVSGILLVKEAGGRVTNWDGAEANIRSQEIIAANNRLHQEFISLLTS